MEIEDYIDGLMFSSPSEPNWVPLGQDTIRAVFDSWKRCVPTEYPKMLLMLMGGHEIQSPIVPAFRYRAAGIAGKQQQLFAAD